MMEGDCLGKKKEADQSQYHNLTELMFSWSLDDTLNEDLYKNQVEKIPLTFSSEGQYLSSFVYPLLEETRAELASSMEIMYRAPFAEIVSFIEAKRKYDREVVYDVKVDKWKNRFSERGKEPYRTLPGDLLILADWKPQIVSDLKQMGRTWAFTIVKTIEEDVKKDDKKDHQKDGKKDDKEDYKEDDTTSVRFQVMTTQPIECQDGMFVIFLTNITTQKRIWNSLHMHRNSNIIKEILYTDHTVKENCDICSLNSNSLSKRFVLNLVSKLNESQRAAIMASVSKMECCHNSSVEQIWGPPGTGKTTTVSVLLFILLQMNCRTLTCAPTNVAIVQVASRVLSLVKESFKTRTANGDSLYSVGDVLLFGNKERLKVDIDTEEIYLEHRIERLTECLGSVTSWKNCIKSMIDLLEDCVSQYHVFVENELFNAKQLRNESKSGRKSDSDSEGETNNLVIKSFIEFFRDRFSSSSLSLRWCIITFCTHIPKSFFGDKTYQNMVSLLDCLCSFESLLFQDNLVSDELEHLFSSKTWQDEEDEFVNVGGVLSITSVRIKSVSILKTLQKSFERLRFPNFRKRYEMMDFCFENASLIFCTTSSSYKLHTVNMEPLNFLVIDEAAQLKEAESTIPLQLRGIRHAILIGDECQLPAVTPPNQNGGNVRGREPGS